MAGGHGDFHPVKLDPAIERWNSMREFVYKHFKFTPRITRQVVTWGVAVPVGLWYLASVTDDRYNFAGVRKGTSALRNPPPAPPAADE